MTPPDTDSNAPPDWPALRFHPVGLFNLRRKLSMPIDASTFRRFDARFAAAEVAWFAAGLAASTHTIGANRFFPELYELRRATNKQGGSDVRRNLRERVRNVTFDCAALLDRSFGSTTLIIHVPGTTRPGSLRREDYVKADVYFQGHLLREEEQFSKTISDLVQKFITDIGLPVIERYERCADWNLGPRTALQPPYAPQDIGPEATPPGSSVFTYYGRCPSVGAVVSDEGEEISRLQEELATMRDYLEGNERLLAKSHRRERALIAEIQRLSGQTVASVTRSLASATIRSAPGTPECSPVTDYGNESGAAPSHPSSAAAGKVPHQVDASDLTSSPAPRESSSAGDSEDSYRGYIKARNLQGKYFAIETIRKNSHMYQWQGELLKLGIEQSVVEYLIYLMSCQRN